MTYFTKPAILAALIVPAAAFAGLELGQPLGTTDADVRAALTGMGYEVQEIEIEDDEIEAEVTLDGVAYEIEVAMDTGLITEIEHEDDAGGDDD
ncbi:PepSY domain-containing protein [uncultured Tateyamaria sp.]|uniref:PepSY domain-containing protein n=1 Tax=uncultured Tateyamaria sp. TaxID=455651 RepID=UPI002632B7FB|nr:PepSY domain-containing protein [uncultured Tateyamaria sp.]